MLLMVLFTLQKGSMISISITTMFEATDDDRLKFIDFGDHGKPDISTATRCFFLISAMILMVT